MPRSRQRKNRKPRQRPQLQSPPQRTSKPAQPPTETKAQLEELYKGAVAGATEAEIMTPPADPRPPEIDLDGMWKMALEARDLFQKAERRHDKLCKDLETQQEDFDCRSRELDDQRAKLEQDKQSHDQRANDLARQEETLDLRESDLKEREKHLNVETQKLARKERELQWHEEDVQEQEHGLDSRVEGLVRRRIAAKQEEYEHRLAALQDERDQARKDRDQHQEALRQREEADRRFGQRSPDQVLLDLDQLKRENERLQAELAARPDDKAIDRLAALDQEQQSWQAERLDLTRQVSELERRLAYADREAGERETQRDLIKSLESRREVLRQANEELHTDMRELVNRRESQSPFPACMAMDKDDELQRAGRNTEDFGSLKEFSQDIRHRIAQKGFYYSEADIRSFIGGLAMGRLILLQGTSGTGKTSLPIQFAKAVGTEASEVKVQAGWRDPQDLVGHYNTFEKQFDEKEFLQALYRAGTPRWKETIQIVLLDEMNLSYPEQYFSEMLSTLELPSARRRLELMTSPTPDAPSQLEEGRWLPIPPNVWFVGTANHDETTMDFAPKTYDRAHVMELPHRPDPFGSGTPDRRYPVSFSVFQRAVKAAVEEHAEQADEVQGYLESLHKQMADHFEIDWGPRLGRQIERYVPVVVAAGGTIGEAADHILAMRLLRKLKNRYNNRPEYLDELKATVEGNWDELERGVRPAKSIGVLDWVLRRVGRDEESAA